MARGERDEEQRRADATRRRVHELMATVMTLERQMDLYSGDLEATRGALAESDDLVKELNSEIGMLRWKMDAEGERPWWRGG